MTIQEINKAYTRVTGQLDNRELKGAFTSLQGIIAGIQAYAFQEKLEEMQDTYKYMLHYRLDGADDPTRERIHHSLLISAYEMADQLRHKALADISPLAFYSKRRNWQVTPPLSFIILRSLIYTSPEFEKEKIEFEKAQISLFHRIWLSDPLTADEALDIKEILYDDYLQSTVGCQIVSALWMGLQMSFDKEKLYLLFDAYRLENEEIRVRALITLLLTLYLYRKRTDLYPQITERLAEANEATPGFTHAIRTIILRFILSRETEKITRRLQEEIIPEMIKLSPKINKKINLKDFTELPGEDMNPEWQELIGDSQLGKKMEEFSELQMEGADVMHSTFVHLKNFPFFRELPNWFLPFSSHHSTFGLPHLKEEKEWDVIETLGSASFMCNSDKYSLYLSILQMPEAARRMMFNQFTGQAGQMLEQQRQELLTKRSSAEIITGQYIQDLYRFYKLYPGRLEFEDIFTLPLDLHNLPVLRPYITDDESLLTIAEYYLHKNYMTDALPLFIRLSEADPQNGILFQKTGFCRQMMGDLAGALADYLHADLLHPNSKWVIRRLAACHRSMKHPEEALRYYLRFEALEPENLSIQLNIGHCLLELKRYEEALKYYYKVDYLDTKGNKSSRAIAWISFLTGNYEQARKYYRRVIDAQPTMQDFMNAGHTEWVMQHIREAVGYYKQSVASEAGGLDKFIEQFNQDTPELLAAGIREEEIPLMLDQLRYALEDTL